ncbi:Laminin subunit alpha-4 [Saguinus oedipus]|uniref:Laminin subunit alpha-4 n=1 Tax=Saguinus oedipus TaxID=9490 RepID=A0ABQ9VXU6_SAGOE|nr:Laminin subunit alpha-4 [Saguinus oedipus]
MDGTHIPGIFRKAPSLDSELHFETFTKLSPQMQDLDFQLQESKETVLERNPAIEKMELFGAFVKKIMLDLTVKERLSPQSTRGFLLNDSWKTFIETCSGLSAVSHYNKGRSPSDQATRRQGSKADSKLKYQCAPGYYGNPLLIGSTCRKCDCSGNSDPNLIFEDCDEITGQCRNCLRNTTGFNCEHCAPGYYGDARIAKNCAVLIKEINQTSMDHLPLTRRLNEILDVCNCGGGPCNSITGECLEEGFEPPTGMDCPTISCDKCIWDLTDDLRLAALSIEEGKSGVLNISSGAAAHRHVNEINTTIYLLKTKLSERENQYALRKIQINNAENTMKSLLSDVEELVEKSHCAQGQSVTGYRQRLYMDYLQENQASRKGRLVYKESMDTINHTSQLVEQAHDMRDKIQGHLIAFSLGGFSSSKILDLTYGSGMRMTQSSHTLEGK